MHYIKQYERKQVISRKVKIPKRVQSIGLSKKTTMASPDTNDYMGSEVKSVFKTG